MTPVSGLTLDPEAGRFFVSGLGLFLVYSLNSVSSALVSSCAHSDGFCSELFVVSSRLGAGCDRDSATVAAGFGSVACRIRAARVLYDATRCWSLERLFL